MKFEIKSRWDEKTLFSIETEFLKLAVEAAVKAKIDLRGADLRGAYLEGADLRGADLGGDLKLKTNNSLFSMGSIGSRQDSLVFYNTDKGIFAGTGNNCFFGSLEDFEKRVIKTHGNNNFATQYLAAIQMIRAIWKEEKNLNLATDLSATRVGKEKIKR